MGLFEKIFGSPTEVKVQGFIDKLTEEVAYRATDKLQNEFIALQEVESATQKVIDLQKEIAKLQAEKDNITEGFARKERELEHKTGLVRSEIEAEKRQASKDFDLRVQEAKLEAKAIGLQEREKAFAEKMTFIEKRFTEEVGYLKEMVSDMSKRLPDATILATKDLS